MGHESGARKEVQATHNELHACIGWVYQLAVAGSGVCIYLGADDHAAGCTGRCDILGDVAHPRDLPGFHDVLGDGDGLQTHCVCAGENRRHILVRAGMTVQVGVDVKIIGQTRVLFIHVFLDVLRWSQFTLTAMVQKQDTRHLTRCLVSELR